MPCMQIKGTRLTRFLVKYSTCTAKNVYALYAQWRIIEIRDAGAKKCIRCHCGRSGLRYVVFIQNRFTKVKSYVGLECAKYFCRRTVPQLMKVLQELSVKGISGTYGGSKGKCHSFYLSKDTLLVRHQRLLRHFFRKVPLQRKCNFYELKVKKGKRSKTPRLVAGRKYKINLGAFAPMPNRRHYSKCNKKRPKPYLLLFADYIKPYRCG